MAQRVKMSKIDKAQRKGRDYLGIGLGIVVALSVALISWRALTPMMPGSDTANQNEFKGYKDITQLDLTAADDFSTIPTAAKKIALPSSWKLIGSINNLGDSYYDCAAEACEVSVLTGLNDDLRTMLVTTKGSIILRDDIPGDDTTERVSVLGETATMQLRYYKIYDGDPTQGNLTPVKSNMVSTLNVCLSNSGLCFFAGPLTPDESKNLNQVKAFRDLLSALKTV